MIAKNVTKEELEQALDSINVLYDNNVCWNRPPEKKGRGWLFTLRVHSSKGPGHRLGYTGRRMASACWHVHGEFFDALLKINPDAVITTCRHTINSAGGNWADYNIGSQWRTLYASAACECCECEV